MAETSTITFIIINDFHKKARENNKSPRVSVSVVSLAELLIFYFIYTRRELEQFRWVSATIPPPRTNSDSTV